MWHAVFRSEKGWSQERSTRLHVVSSSVHSVFNRRLRVFSRTPPPRSPGRCFRVSAREVWLQIRGLSAVETPGSISFFSSLLAVSLMVFPWWSSQQLGGEQEAEDVGGHGGMGGQRPRHFNFIQQHEGQLKVGHKKQARREDWHHSLYESQLASQLA